MNIAVTTKISSKNDLINLRREVSALRSFVIGLAGTDKEGSYRPALIRETIEASLEPVTHSYSGKGSLLKQIKKV